MSQTLKSSGDTTEGVDYTDRLQRLSGAGWKRALNVKPPCRWNIRRLDLGFTLDVGCGIGRNLEHLDGNGVGVDHNPTSIAACRAAGLTAFTIEDFFKSEYATPGRFDAVLGAHLIEHVEEEQAKEIISSYLPFLRSAGGPSSSRRRSAVTPAMPPASVLWLR